MMAAVHVGTSGYNYPEWRGSFYPDKMKASDMLAFYAARFRTVEINATFYRMPNAATLAGWAAGTPPGFVFTLKAPQRITHMKRLRDVDRLRNVLVQIPADLRCAFEFRHDSWFADDVYEALRVRDAALCVADTDAGSTPDEATASWGYYRLRNVDYPDAQLAAWAKALTRTGRGDVFCYFKHEDAGTGPALAARLRTLLQQI